MAHSPLLSIQLAFVPRRLRRCQMVMENANSPLGWFSSFLYLIAVLQTAPIIVCFERKMWFKGFPPFPPVSFSFKIIFLVATFAWSLKATVRVSVAAAASFATSGQQRSKTLEALVAHDWWDFIDKVMNYQQRSNRLREWAQGTRCAHAVIVKLFFKIDFHIERINIT